MKKIMILALGAMAVCAANATTVKWASGVLYQAKDATGAFSDASASKIKDGAAIACYVLTDEQYTTYSAKSGADILAAADAGTFGKAVQTATTSKTLSSYTWSDTINIGVTKNIAMIATYTDATYGDMYIAKVATTKPASATQYSVSNILSTGSTWTPAPEPTSGLLMLLGMAGLALRRRRA